MAPRTRAALAVAAAGGAAALALAYAGSFLFAAAAGLLTVLVGLVVIAVWRRWRAAPEAAPDPSRRRFLGVSAAAGLAAVAVGTGVGTAVKRLARPDPKPVVDAMARDLGSRMATFVRRGHYPGRTGELQLALQPFTVSNYANESTSLIPEDPRTSHAAPWMYLQRIPIAVYAPGIAEPADHAEPVTVADIAATGAHLMGFTGFQAPDGAPLPGIPRPATPPKVIVTFVIDGGGWNALQRFPRAWPELRALMRDGAVYTDAVIGSFPAVTAAAHATIGTGGFPSTHGIVGHNIRNGPHITQPLGDEGHATTERIVVPTLAEAWAEETGGEAWAGLLAYQIWHLSMVGNPGPWKGRPPVGTYFDEQTTRFAPQHPDDYRLPDGMPPREQLTGYVEGYFTDPEDAARVDRKPKELCCHPPVVRYQGDMILAALEHEGVGTRDVTDLVYINYKAPDYAGHTWNFLNYREGIAIRAVDREIGRLRAFLDQRFRPGEYVLVVTADHGQSPLPDRTGGARVDPIQLKASLEREFGPGFFDLIQDVKPSEVYVHTERLWEYGVSLDDLAAFLRDYRYRDNIGPYVPDPAIDERRLDDRLFAAVLPNTYVGELDPEVIAGLGDGVYGGEDPGIPPVTWR